MDGVELHVRLEGRTGLARQIYRQVRAAIVDGRLRRGDRLPPTRELARRLDVSRNTVSLAYEWLVAQGLLSGRKGAGSFVEGEPIVHRRRRPGPSIWPRPAWEGIVAPAVPVAVPRFDFGVGMPDATLFPFDAWRRLVARQIRPGAMAGGYGDPAGHSRLRAAIVRHVAVARGVDADPDDVVVTPGAQGAFDLVARVLLEPGATVAVEEPGYPPARHLFQSCGARVQPVPVDEGGLDVARLPGETRLVYVTPSHQFPLGMPLSHPRRVALLDWAARRDALVIEDDYDSEFRFGGRPLETLQALDRGGRVVYVGSFSKSLLPALRLGFLIAPPSLRDAFEAASYVAGWHVPETPQRALASFVETGLLARHIRRMRRIYAARHERLLGALQKELSAWVAPLPSLTGLHLAAPFRSAPLRAEMEVTSRARRAGVRVDRLSGYCAGTPRPGLVLGYGAIDESRIEEALRRLRRCF